MRTAKVDMLGMGDQYVKMVFVSVPYSLDGAFSVPERAETIEIGCSFFAYGQKFPAYNRVFYLQLCLGVLLLTVGVFGLTAGSQNGRQPVDKIVGTQFGKVTTAYEYWESLSPFSAQFDREFLYMLVYCLCCRYLAQLGLRQLRLPAPDQDVQVWAFGGLPGPHQQGRKNIHHHRGNPPFFLFRGLRLYGVYPPFRTYGVYPFPLFSQENKVYTIVFFGSVTSGSGDRPRKEGCRGGGVYSFFPDQDLFL